MGKIKDLAEDEAIVLSKMKDRKRAFNIVTNMLRNQQIEESRQESEGSTSSKNAETPSTWKNLKVGYITPPPSSKWIDEYQMKRQAVNDRLKNLSKGNISQKFLNKLDVKSHDEQI